MSKFGELIHTEVPVFINFFAQWSESSKAMDSEVIGVAAALGDKVKVIKIDVDKNPELVDALRIKGVPTLMVYKEGKMVWRQAGELDANSIIIILQEYI